VCDSLLRFTPFLCLCCQLEELSLELSIGDESSNTYIGPDLTTSAAKQLAYHLW